MTVPVTVTVTDGDENTLSVTVEVLVSVECHEDVAVDDTVAEGAVGYAEGNGYTFTAKTISVEDGTITVTYAEGTELVTSIKAIRDDLARFLGGLHDQGVLEIEFEGVTYVWDDSEPLQGSNWYDSEDDKLISSVNTLIAALGDYFDKNSSELATDPSIQLTIDGTRYTLTMEVGEGA